MMNKDSLIDYLSYILFRALGFLFRCLPLNFGLFFGRRLGDFLYYFDFRHKAIAYANLKVALGDKLSPRQLNQLTHRFYRCLGQNLIEMFFIPLVNKKYLEKYISIDGLENIYEGFRRGKGVILLGTHSGSWELSNIISANIGFPFSLLVRDQDKFKRVSELLNEYRRQKGCKLIQRQNQTRQLIELLKNNESIGMTVDQGGRQGALVKFFAKDASMATGALRLSFKYGSAIIPAFYRRVSGPYIKIVLKAPFEIKKTANPQEDLKENLQNLVKVFEEQIAEYPQEYLWTYKIWKYGKEKNILILSDGKAGHLRQAQALAKIVLGYFREKGCNVGLETAVVKFKNRLARLALSFGSCFSGKYCCQGCLVCLKSLLEEESCRNLSRQKPDVIISCGSGLAPINFLLARENLAKTIVIMRPSLLSARRFDLVIMPKHDHPPRRKNIVVTEGALNLVDEAYLKEQSAKLIQGQGLYLGLLIGGDTKGFRLDRGQIKEILGQVKSAAQNLGAQLLVTTSRRTSPEIETLVRKELKDYPGCKLLVIANEKNIPEAVGGILGASQLVIVSPESISMISEAASSGRYVIVFESEGLSKKHRRFLDNLARDKYIYLVKAQDIRQKIEQLMQDKPPIKILDDAGVVREAVARII